VSQGEPACGIFVGHPVPGVAHAHSGGSIIWQLGYPDPPAQPLHQQRVPSEYQHARVESEHALAALGGGERHAGGSGGLLQEAGGAVTDQVQSD